MSTRGGITGLLDDRHDAWRIVPLIRQSAIGDWDWRVSSPLVVQLFVERIRLEVRDASGRLPIIAAYRVYERISEQCTMVAMLVPTEDVFAACYGTQLFFPCDGQPMRPYLWHEYIRFTGRLWASDDLLTDLVARYWVSEMHDGSERDPLDIPMRGGAGTYQSLAAAVDAGVNDLIDRFDREEQKA